MIFGGSIFHERVSYMTLMNQQSNSAGKFADKIMPSKPAMRSLCLFRDAK